MNHVRTKTLEMDCIGLGSRGVNQIISNAMVSSWSSSQPKKLNSGHFYDLNCFRVKERDLDYDLRGGEAS